MTATSIAYRKALWAFLISVLLQAPAHAQTSDSSRAPVSVGVSYQQMVPSGEFRENTRGASRLYQGALGFDLNFHLNSAVNLRLDYLFGSYDRNPCEGWCDRYSFRAGGVGGELVLPRGPVRPYGTAGLGRVSFRSFDDTNGIKADTGAGYLMYGVGVRVPLNHGVSIDLAWRHHDAGPVSYQYVQQNPDGSTVESSARTRTPFDMFTLGFQWRLGGASR